MYTSVATIASNTVAATNEPIKTGSRPKVVAEEGRSVDGAEGGRASTVVVWVMEDSCWIGRQRAAVSSLALSTVTADSSSAPLAVLKDLIDMRTRCAASASTDGGPGGGSIFASFNRRILVHPDEDRRRLVWLHDAPLACAPVLPPLRRCADVVPGCTLSIRAKCMIKAQTLKVRGSADWPM